MKCNFLLLAVAISGLLSAQDNAKVGTAFVKSLDGTTRSERGADMMGSSDGQKNIFHTVHPRAVRRLSLRRQRSAKHSPGADFLGDAGRKLAPARVKLTETQFNGRRSRLSGARRASAGAVGSLGFVALMAPQS